MDSKSKGLERGGRGSCRCAEEFHSFSTASRNQTAEDNNNADGPGAPLILVLVLVPILVLGGLTQTKQSKTRMNSVRPPSPCLHGHATRPGLGPVQE